MTAAIDITDEQMRLVEEYASLGITWDGIASIMGISRATLIRKCEAAYHRGIHSANAKIAGALYSKAIAGDTASMCFWLKCRARWREKDREDVDRVEMTGKDGAPLWGSAHDKLVSLVTRLVKQRGTSGLADATQPDGG